MEIFNAKDLEKMLNLALKMSNWRHRPLRFTNFTTNVNLHQYVHRVLRIAETVALCTSQGNAQHTVKHIRSAENEIILPIYVEALLLLDQMQGKSMRSQPVLHHNQTQAFCEYSPFVGGKREHRRVKNAVKTTGKWYSYVHLQVGHWCRSKYSAV